MCKSHFYFFCAICMLMVACRTSEQELKFTPPQFKDTVNLQGRIINDSFVMGLGYDIDFYKDYLVVNAFKGEGEEVVHIFRISDGTHLKSILSEGRGPGEAIAVDNFDLDPQTGEVLFYDYMSWKLFHFNLDSVICHKNVVEYIVRKDYPINMFAIYLGLNGYIAKGGTKQKTGETPRFSIIENDSVIFRYNTFPEVTIPGIPEGVIPCYTYGSLISLSSDRTRMACVLGYGAILEIFEIQKDKILLDTIKGFYRPEFTLDKNKVVLSTPQTIFGFSDLYTTDKYIYTTFCSQPDKTTTNEVAVFDWKGNCVCLFRVEYTLEKICVDEANNRLYAICQNKDFETMLVEFDLSGNI